MSVQALLIPCKGGLQGFAGGVCGLIVVGDLPSAVDGDCFVGPADSVKGGQPRRKMKKRRGLEGEFFPPGCLRVDF